MRKKNLRKTFSSLVKIISDGENNFTQNKYNKLQKISVFLQKISAFLQKRCAFLLKISAKFKYGIIYSSITWCRPDRYSNSKLIIKLIFILYKWHVII